MHKAQSALEFIVLASFMLLIILSFFAVTSSRTLEAREEGNRIIAENIAELAYDEIEIAKSVNDGYIRVFSMPQTVNGINYDIRIIDDRELVVEYLDNEFVKFLPSNVIGNITKGLNIISKSQDIISINKSEIILPPSIANLIMKGINLNAIVFDNSGNIILKGNLQKNHGNPPITGSDEFIFKDKNGIDVAVINLNSGNMFIKGDLFENQATLTPSASSDDFIVKDFNSNIISYIDDSGNLYLKGTLTERGNP